MADSNQQVIDEFRRSGGTVQARGFGRSLVLLHHRGARSGTERVNPLRAIRVDADTWYVAGSKGGAPDNPAWFHNLQAHPDVTIETPDDGVVRARAEVLEGEARDAGWAKFTEQSEGFRSYESRTTRVIPVVALHRVDA